MGHDYETAAPDRYPLLKDFARHNRREMTESETVLWDALRRLKSGFRFRRQHPIGDYIADFIDGGYHNEPTQQEADALRTKFLQSKGFQVLRFKNEEINDDVKKVVMRIKEYLSNSSNDAPRPLERGRG